MYHLFKAIQCGSADAARRGARVVKFRMRLLKPLQFVKKAVVFIIGDFRCIFNIIFARVILKLASQLRNSLRCFFIGLLHAHDLLFRLFFLLWYYIFEKKSIPCPPCIFGKNRVSYSKRIRFEKEMP